MVVKSPKVIIREILKNELEFLKEMLYEALFVMPGQPKLSKSIIEEPMLSKYIDGFGMDPLDVCLVAVENGQLVGASWGRLFNEENKGYGFLDAETPELSIAIKEVFRNQGIGAELIHALIKVYRAANIKAISLSVDQQNPAVRLYKRIGFETLRETEKSFVMRMII